MNKFLIFLHFWEFWPKNVRGLVYFVNLNWVCFYFFKRNSGAFFKIKYCITFRIVKWILYSWITVDCLPGSRITVINKRFGLVFFMNMQLTTVSSLHWQVKINFLKLNLFSLIEFQNLFKFWHEMYTNKISFLKKLYSTGLLNESYEFHFYELLEFHFYDLISLTSQTEFCNLHLTSFPNFCKMINAMPTFDPKLH